MRGSHAASGDSGQVLYVQSSSPLGCESPFLAGDDEPPAEGEACRTRKKPCCSLLDALSVVQWERTGQVDVRDAPNVSLSDTFNERTVIELLPDYATDCEVWLHPSKKGPKPRNHSNVESSPTVCLGQALSQLHIRKSPLAPNCSRANLLLTQFTSEACLPRAKCQAGLLLISGAVEVELEGLTFKLADKARGNGTLPSMVHVSQSTNVTFTECDFETAELERHNSGLKYSSLVKVEQSTGVSFSQCQFFDMDVYNYGCRKLHQHTASFSLLSLDLSLRQGAASVQSSEKSSPDVTVSGCNFRRKPTSHSPKHSLCADIHYEKDFKGSGILGRALNVQLSSFTNQHFVMQDSDASGLFSTYGTHLHIVFKAEPNETWPYVQRSTVTIRNCTFANNKARIGGAALVQFMLFEPEKTSNLPLCNFYGCTFINNYAKKEGGAVAIHGLCEHGLPGVLQITDTVFRENVARIAHRSMDQPGGALSIGEENFGVRRTGPRARQKRKWCVFLTNVTFERNQGNGAVMTRSVDVIFRTAR